MRRRLPFLVLLLAGLLPLMPSARAGDADAKPAAAARIAWFSDLAAARKVATRVGRPIFIAIHVRPGVASPDAAARLERWVALYRQPAIVALSRRYACVLRVIQAPEGQDPDKDAGPAAVHLVVDGTSRVLGRWDAAVPLAGAAGVHRLGSLLRGGLKNFGPIAADAPRIDARLVARTKVALDGISPSKPVGLPQRMPGIRLHLHWELPAPRWSGGKQDRVHAAVRMRWDGAGPFDLGEVTFQAGEEIDRAIDVRFKDVEGLPELVTKGVHRVDLYLEPLPDSVPFSKGPLHVGRVWIDVGDGGGGGGSSADNPDEPDPKEQQPSPPPRPEPGETEAPPPPPPEREEVVDPFVNEGETVKKDDAVVAVEDPDGGIKPPRQVPLEQALRTFEKLKEREVSRPGFSARDRSLLRRYFDLLGREARGDAAGKKAAGKQGGDKKGGAK